MTITEQAIIAGAKAMDAYWGGRYAPDEVEELRGEVTAMLEAAAPIIRAEALQAAADEGWQAVIEYSEHTNQVTPVGYLHNWLRARAAAERGEG